ncbi:Glutathione S-transferase [Diplonema papillatum]|nr:Glutathione S-transferase [Diplonema papillatum]|eukprot:gene20507-31576_t
MPTLYAFPVSQPSRACLWLVEYAELKDVDVKNVNILEGESKTPEYLAKFPVGQVPALEDGDFCFAESTAIMQYIAEGHAILPKDKKAKAYLQQYFGNHNSNIRKMTTELLRPVVSAKSAEERDEAIAKGIEVLTPILKKYDDVLGKQKFVIGDALTLADFLFATEVDQMYFMQPELLPKTYPNIHTYLQNLRAVTGYTKNFETAQGIVKSVSDARGY